MLGKILKRKYGKRKSDDVRKEIAKRRGISNWRTVKVERVRLPKKVKLY